MRSYAMSYPAVMALPMRVFWHLSGSVDRLVADESKVKLEIMVSMNAPDAAAALREHFASVAPDPIKLSGNGIKEATSVRDDAGFEELRAMAR